MDKNHLSISGDNLGRVFVQQTCVFADGKMTDAIEYVRERHGVDVVLIFNRPWIYVGDVVANPGESDTLKLSNLSGVNINARSIDGRNASEDTIDANHCSDVVVIVDDLWPGKKYCATIKGSSKGVMLSVKRQHGHGGETDFDLGNFSDQGNEKTTAIIIDSTTVDGSKVKVRLLSADCPTFGNGAENYAVTKLNQGWFYTLFDLWKGILKLFGKK
jgi:hypothetical protein